MLEKIDKKKLKKLILKLYPSKNIVGSYKLCSEDMGYSYSMIYKSCEENNFPIRTIIYKYLEIKEELKNVEMESKMIDFDKRDLQMTKTEISNKLKELKNKINDNITYINNTILDLRRKMN